jgi:hypothetical protein
MSSSDPKLDAVEDAVRKNNDAALKKALKALGESYLWGSLELRAHEKLKANDPDLAFGIYVVIANGQRPSLGAWNNLCYALNLMKNRPHIAIAQPLLERAMAAGPMNSSIFHNVACCAMKYDLRELAFEAIAGASKYGYDKMDRIRADEELATLANDARFEASLNAKIRWTPEELEKLTVMLTKKGEKHVVHRAIMEMTFHASGELAEITPRIAALLDAYLADLPDDTLTFYGRGYYKPLTKGMLTKTRNELLKLPARRRYVHVDLRPTDGDACEFEFHVAGDGEEGLTITLAFPLVEAHDPDAFEARFVRYATILRAEAGHAGFGVSNRESGSYEGFDWNEDGLTERFMAFQSKNPWWAPGRAPPAHWLVWLGSRLKSKKEFGEARSTTTEAGRAFRAARVPPVAADDAGAIPDISRALRPIRIEANGDSNVAYLARWDELKSTAWENAPDGWKPIPSKLGAVKAPPAKKRNAKKKSFFDA